MVRHRYRSLKHRAKGMNLQKKVEQLAGAGAFLYPGVNKIHEKWGSEPAWAAVVDGIAVYGGIENGSFNWGTLGKAWLPFIGFTLARSGAHKLAGLIRRL